MQRSKFSNAVDSARKSSSYLQTSEVAPQFANRCASLDVQLRSLQTFVSRCLLWFEARRCRQATNRLLVFEEIVMETNRVLVPIDPARFFPFDSLRVSEWGRLCTLAAVESCGGCSSDTSEHQPQSPAIRLLILFFPTVSSPKQR